MRIFLGDDSGFKFLSRGIYFIKLVILLDIECLLCRFCVGDKVMIKKDIIFVIIVSLEFYKYYLLSFFKFYCLLILIIFFSFFFWGGRN